MLPVAYLNFVYTPILHPAPTSPDLLPLYRPLAEESIGIGHLHPTFSSFSLLLYLFFRKDIYSYIYRARTIYINRGNRQQGNISAQPPSGKDTCLPRCCTLLKPGNGIHGRREGHILVGTRGARGLLIHPRMAFDTLYGRIRKSLERGHSVTLEVKEDRL